MRLVAFFVRSFFLTMLTGLFKNYGQISKKLSRDNKGIYEVDELGKDSDEPLMFPKT